GELAAAGQQRAGALDRDRRQADDDDDDPGGAHRVSPRPRRPMRHAALAATIGIPGGTNGISTSAMAAPSNAATTARRSRSWPASSARKSAGKAASSPSFAGSPRSDPNATP